MGSRWAGCWRRGFVWEVSSVPPRWAQRESWRRDHLEWYCIVCPPLDLSCSQSPRASRSTRACNGSRRRIRSCKSSKWWIAIKYNIALMTGFLQKIYFTMQDWLFSVQKTKLFAFLDYQATKNKKELNKHGGLTWKRLQIFHDSSRWFAPRRNRFLHWSLAGSRVPLVSTGSRETNWGKKWRKRIFGWLYDQWDDSIKVLAELKSPLLNSTKAMVPTSLMKKIPSHIRGKQLYWCHVTSSKNRIMRKQKYEPFQLPISLEHDVAAIYMLTSHWDAWAGSRWPVGNQE